MTATLRYLARNDLYFLLRYICGRKDLEHPWLFARCREVQESPNGHLDLWAREHYKSTIITFGKSIQDILNSHGDDPALPREVTIGIFSHTRPIAKDFLRQIKRELEDNERLKELFPDILWQNPRAEAPKWSEDDGLIVRRKTNPKEATVEAWGLVDGMPTGKHFFIRAYDDVVTEKSVTTPDMIRKTTTAWELSDNLGTEGGWERYIGTRYHFNDTYAEMKRRNVVGVREYPCTADGQENGDPVLKSRETLIEKRRKQGPYTFGCQMLLNPKGDETQGFQEAWLTFYAGQNDGSGMNKYILVDPANSKKKQSDYTAMWVVGLAQDQNYYVLEIVRDRLNLQQRADTLFRLHRKWRPLGVGYEQYGIQADIQHMQDRMRQENYRFSITELGGSLAKADRIRRLMPLFEQGRIWLPETWHITDYQGLVVDLVHSFIQEEYKAFPVGVHDDMLDSLARICDDDLNLTWPRPTNTNTDSYRPARRRSASGWAA